LDYLPGQGGKMMQDIKPKVWQERITRYRKSGKSLRKFCLSNQIPMSAMRYHIRKDQQAQFAEITLPKPAMLPIAIHIGEHFKIVIEPGTDCESLIPILKAVKEAVCS
jgi:hypothetical protein